MSIKDLVDVVAQLRGPDGCPWDKAQTPQSLTRYILEEAFELAEAIDSGDAAKIRDELGDYLFQVVLQAQIASETGGFNFDEVARASAEKMKRRHPHVFSPTGAAADASARLASPDQVTKKWEEIKKAEKASLASSASATSSEKSSSSEIFAANSGDKIMEPFRMPALLAALKIGERSMKWKFDWETREQVFEKVEEEIAEVFEEVEKLEALSPAGLQNMKSLSSDHRGAKLDSSELENAKKNLEDEFGDFLFASAQWARHLGLDPEQALRKANEKFQKRFATMIQDSGLDRESFSALPLDEMEQLWAKAKKKLKSQN